MRTRILINTALAICLIVANVAQAGQYENARSLALAKSFTALARNYQAIGINPANLAFSDNSGFSLGLFSVGAEVTNNSFSLADYNNYTGQHLSQSDKDNILSKIPSGGLQGNLSSAASALAISVGQFAFGLTGEGSGRINLDKTIIELMLNGNSLGDSVALSDAFGTGVAHADFNFSYGAKLFSRGWGQVNWGVNAKYIRGLAYAEISEAQGYVVTRAEGVSSEGAAQIRYSEGGTGFGLDLGLSAIYGDRWNFSLALTNLASRVTWNKNNKLNKYFFTWNHLTLENSDEDSAITSEDSEESIGPFSTSLAPQLAIGASTNLKSFLLSLDFKQGFKNLGNVSTTPQISLGCEAKFLGILPLRTGIALGGVDKTSAAIGFGLNLSPFFLDFAYMSTGSLIPVGGKGMGLAVSSGLTF